MNFNEYQIAARRTAMYPNLGKNLYYPTLGLCGESGEVAEKIKKIFRDDNGVISLEKRIEIVKELGDVLWYISNLSSELEVSLEDIAIINIDKLNKRKNTNKLYGNGDNR